MAIAGWLIGLGLFNIISATQIDNFPMSMAACFLGAVMFAFAGYEIEKKFR